MPRDRSRPEAYSLDGARGLQQIVTILQDGRDSILRDWVERVRENVAVTTEDALNDPLLLDHLPQLFDAIIDRLEINRSREDAEQFAAVHGFTRRISGYDMAESVIEMMMFRRAIWAHLVAVSAPVHGAFVAMEEIDGMVDRSVIASLRAFLDPSAKMLVRKVNSGGPSTRKLPAGDLILRPERTDGDDDARSRKGSSSTQPR